MYLYTPKYIHIYISVTCRYHSSGMTSRYASAKRAGTKGGQRNIASHRGEDPRATTYRRDILRFSRGRTAGRFCLYPVGYSPRLYIDFTFERSRVLKTRIIREREEPEARIFFDKRPGGNLDLTHYRGRSLANFYRAALSRCGRSLIISLPSDFAENRKCQIF